MREVEIKFQVKDKPALLERLGVLECQLGEAVFQDDLVFERPDAPQPRCVLRIRTTEAGSILTLKKDITNELDCLEIETGVADPTATRRLLEELGYRLVVRVKKQRRQGQWEDWAVCLDEVDDLGTFMEVEAMFEDDVGGDLQNDLWQAVTEQLALSGLDRVTSGYDTLLRNR